MLNKMYSALFPNQEGRLSLKVNINGHRFSEWIKCNQGMTITADSSYSSNDQLFEKKNYE